MAGSGTVAGAGTATVSGVGHGCRQHRSNRHGLGDRADREPRRWRRPAQASIESRRGRRGRRIRRRRRADHVRRQSASTPSRALRCRGVLAETLASCRVRHRCEVRCSRGAPDARPSSLLVHRDDVPAGARTGRVPRPSGRSSTCRWLDPGVSPGFCPGACSPGPEGRILVLARRGVLVTWGRLPRDLPGCPACRSVVLGICHASEGQRTEHQGKYREKGRQYGSPWSLACRPCRCCHVTRSFPVVPGPAPSGCA